MKDKILLRLSEVGYKSPTTIKELIENRMILIDIVDEVLNEEYNSIEKDKSKSCNTAL